MITILDKVKNTIDRHHLLEKGDRVVVAISGGPDSVCLLHILHRLSEEYEIHIYGAHLNHNFRGMEAQKDAQYVNKLCEELNIMCFIKSMDVGKYAKDNGYSLEEAGRILRYQFFDEVSDRVGANKIAVAHNQNDQAETVLMRLLRGAGPQGLSAIRHKRDRIIRPLLEVARKDIEGYCQEYSLNPRIDHTNLQAIYHRNKIRLELLPYLEKDYNPNIIEALVRTAALLKTDNDFLELQARDSYNLLKKVENDCLYLPILGINKLHMSLKTRMFRLAAEELVKKAVLEYKHINSIIELMENSETGKQLMLPEGIVVSKSYNQLIFTLKDAEEDNAYYYMLNVNDTTYIPELLGEIRLKLVPRQELAEIPRETLIKAFDWDKVKNQLIVRNRKPGDRFMPLGLKGHKKLKDFFIDLKVERGERDTIPLICDGDEIMWIVGYRISEEYKIRKETNTVLIVEFIKN